MARAVALLRGINVGGKKLLKMAALKTSFERLGLTDVATYIQSGNVVFSAPRVEPALARRISGALADEYGHEVPVTLRDAKQLQAVLAAAPKGFGQQPDTYRSDVIFLFDGLTPQRVLRAVELRDGVDTAHAGPGCLYFARLTARASQSKLTKIVSSPLYAQMTIRNWNTTTALARLASE